MNKVKNIKRIILKTIKYIFIIFILIFLILMLRLYNQILLINKRSLVLLKELYDINKVHNKKNSYKNSIQNNHVIKLNTRIYSKDLKLIKIINTENRDIIHSLSYISEHFINALIINEDKNFLHHTGYNIGSIIRALIKNIQNHKVVEGGSTITQQLAKIVFTSHKKNLSRKIYELILAINIEKHYNKRDILLMYVNYIYFGFNTFGIKDACKLYFNKEPKDLSIAESAFLVSLIPNPSLYSPYKNEANIRTKHIRILYKMSKIKKYKHLNYTGIYRRFWKNFNKVKFKNKDLFHKLKAPNSYISDEIIRRSINIIMNKFQKTKLEANKIVFNNGLKIYSTIDTNFQKLAIKSVQKGLYTYRHILVEKNLITPAEMQDIQGALITMNKNTGELYAIVGGSSYKNIKYNHATQAKRQTGSLFKTFVYVAALENNLITPYSIYRNHSYQTIKVKNSVWNVKNSSKVYQDKLITINDALRISSNTITANLITKFGVQPVRDIIKKALNIDIDTLKSRFPLSRYSIALGTTEMSVNEINTLYNIINNNGKIVRPYLISKIVDSSNNIIYQHNTKINKERVVSTRTVKQIKSMLYNVMEYPGTGYKLSEKLHPSILLAGKTGTSQKSKDLWFTGLNKELTSTVWIGHEQAKELYGFGSEVAGPIFINYVNSLYYRGYIK